MLVTEPERIDRLADEVDAIWKTMGSQIMRTQARLDDRLDRFDGRLGRVESDIAVLKEDVRVLKDDVGALKDDVGALKGDVATLKVDVATLKVDMIETKDRLGRLERAMHDGFSRVEARIERLVGLIVRDELG